MRALAIIALLLAFTLAIPGPSPVSAQSCRSVDVRDIRHRRVELFDLQGTPVTVVSRRELGGITVALECPDTPAFLGIMTQGRRWLVRRAALELAGPEILPICTDDEYRTQARRNASSSGVGSAGCRPAQQ